MLYLSLSLVAALPLSLFLLKKILEMEKNYHRRERDRLLNALDSAFDRIQLGRPQYMQAPPEKIEEPEDDPLPEWASLG